MWEAQASPSVGHRFRKISSVTKRKNSNNNLQRPQADSLQIQMNTRPRWKV